MLTIPWDLAKLVKIFPGIIVRQDRTDRKQIGLLKEQFRRIKEGTSAVLWQSGLNESSLLCDRVVRPMNSKTNVFSDSVLCLGSITPEPVQAWRGKFKWYLETRYLKELDRIDGEQMEVEWKNS